MYGGNLFQHQSFSFTFAPSRRETLSCLWLTYTWVMPSSLVYHCISKKLKYCDSSSLIYQIKQKCPQPLIISMPIIKSHSSNNTSQIIRILLKLCPKKARNTLQSMYEPWKFNLINLWKNELFESDIFFGKCTRILQKWDKLKKHHLERVASNWSLN